MKKQDAHAPIYDLATIEGRKQFIQDTDKRISAIRNSTADDEYFFGLNFPDLFEQELEHDGKQLIEPEGDRLMVAAEQMATALRLFVDRFNLEYSDYQASLYDAIHYSGMPHGAG